MLSTLLFQALGITAYQSERLIQRSPNTYKIYKIPKKSGGHRVIAQPAKETKFIQHWLIKNLFNRLPVHRCAKAYKTGGSIKQNAFAHKNNSYMAKFDFKNFFNSIQYSHVTSFLAQNFGNEFVAEDIERIAQVCCVKIPSKEELCLSVGAPTSPLLSNAILFEFDTKIFAWCIEHSFEYTRYADDLTFSTSIRDSCNKIEPMLRAVIDDLANLDLVINERKTTHLSKKFKRRVTGLIIDNNNNISLGRDRKRKISAMVHQFSIGILKESDVYKIQGLLGFAVDIEPEFISRMNDKYGNEVIDDIFKKRTHGEKISDIPLHPTEQDDSIIPF